jgi:hypothetical protein
MPMSSRAPSSAPAPAPAPAGPQRAAKRRSPVLVQVAIVVGAIAVIGLVGYYGRDIKAYVSLHAWSKSGPTATVESFAAALKANDMAALKALVPEKNLTIAEEGGHIATLKIGEKSAAAASPVAALLPTGSVAEATIKFDLYFGHAVVAYHTSTGEAKLTLRRDGGRWQVVAADAVSAGPRSP